MVLENEECCVSIASLWEISIKYSIGKLELKQSIQEIADICIEYGIQIEAQGAIQGFFFIVRIIYPK